MMKIFNFFKPKKNQPTIDNYGHQDCDIEQQQIQLVMEWLFGSLINAGYFGKSHIIWYNSDKPNPNLEKIVKKIIGRDEPIFLYRCGGRVSLLPNDYYWRMVDEHPSMRIYQLEVKQD
jgi:hypothetical protein